jgi:hypothetical protein
LSWSVDDALTRISITQRPVGPNDRRTTNGLLIDPILQT